MNTTIKLWQAILWSTATMIIGFVIGISTDDAKSSSTQRDQHYGHGPVDR